MIQRPDCSFRPGYNDETRRGAIPATRAFQGIAVRSIRSRKSGNIFVGHPRERFMDLVLARLARLIQNSNDRLDRWTALLRALQLGDQDRRLRGESEMSLDPAPDERNPRDISRLTTRHWSIKIEVQSSPDLLCPPDLRLSGFCIPGPSPIQKGAGGLSETSQTRDHEAAAEGRAVALPWPIFRPSRAGRRSAPASSIPRARSSAPDRRDRRH
jgi:hypothetical protein